VFAEHDALQEHYESLRNRVRDFQNPTDEMVSEAQAARDEAQKAYDEHLQASGGYAGGKEARRLRVGLRKAENDLQELNARREGYAKGERVEDEHVADLRRQLTETREKLWDVGRRESESLSGSGGTCRP
jgi:polyhydroxyalkanoate synthesis regulator phasin